MLFAKMGYSYTIKLTKSNHSTILRCSMRQKDVPRRATVVQKGNEFSEGIFAHNHPAQPRLALKARTMKSIKESKNRDPISLLQSSHKAAFSKCHSKSPAHHYHIYDYLAQNTNNFHQNCHPKAHKP